MKVSKRPKIEGTAEEALRGAAFHEAGHVIVARFFGLTVKEIEIDEDGSGRATISSAEHLPLVDQIALCVAGVEAQVLFECGTRDYGAFGDYLQFSKLVEGLTEKESFECRNAAFLRCLEILKTRAGDVEWLARYLMVHRRIDRSRLSEF
jgi:hypothetical protein